MPIEGSLTIKDIYQIMVGYQQSQIMYTACSLNVFDVLHKANDGMTSDVLANRIRSEPEAVDRLLNACVGIGLVDVHMDANGIATYSNTTATEMFLTNSSAMSIKTLCLMQGDFYKIWGRLSMAVKDGSCQMPLAIGTGCDMFEKGSGFHASEEKQYSFMQCMHMFSRMDSPHVVEAFDLSEFDTACDLGGNFFQDPLPRVDLFVLSHVIHDWNEEKINLLLSNVYKALRPGGALLLCEKMLQPLKDGPMNTLLFDIGMLLSSEGKERTTDEYRTLLLQNGFTDIQVKQLPEMCFRDVIMARK
ncbi:hypothetical protein LSH36_79g04021 [Paralvinella palmiformis]|uniref:Acetylserotonin O-methyltransferase n=1 Tax=Paralvinella palmiformis TaxID=53620 RepID=A0AAD9K2R2_9ANNE|nr:hypothetical protein LSH36_79g04021 [Paralvinella palmiformis]